MKRFILAALAVGALCMFANSANAATYFVDKISMDKSYVVGLTNPDGLNVGNVYANPQVMHTTDGTDFLLLCVDMFHYDTLGSKSPPQSYHTGELTDDFGGNPLSDDQIGQLGWLWRQMVSTTDHFQWAGIQTTAWRIEGGTVDFKGNTALADLSNTLLADTHRVDPSLVYGIISDDGHQSGVGVVPEPASWALMILGFGGAGAALRRRRAVLV